MQSVDADPEVVSADMGPLKYKHLIIAVGQANYFGKKKIEQNTWAFKAISDAIHLWNKSLQDFEYAL